MKRVSLLLIARFPRHLNAHSTAVLNDNLQTELQRKQACRLCTFYCKSFGNCPSVFYVSLVARKRVKCSKEGDIINHHVCFVTLSRVRHHRLKASPLHQELHPCAPLHLLHAEGGQHLCEGQGGLRLGRPAGL